MTRRVGAADQRRSVVLALLALLVAAAAAAAAPSTFGAFTTTVTNETNTAASSIFGSTDTCQSVTNVGTPYFLYPLSDASGTAVADTSTPARPGTYRGNPIGYRQRGPCPRDAGTGLDLNLPVTATTGTAFLSGPSATVTGPGTFSTSIWFKTSSTRGGRLIGFGNGTGTAKSSSYDRHLYLTNAGKVVFGVRPGGTIRTLASATGYNDNQWHHAVGTLSSATGMRLWVDGVSVANSATVTTAQSYSGQWRIGWDNLLNWPEAPASEYYQGSLAWASVHTTVLTQAQVQAIYAAGQ